MVGEFRAVNGHALEWDAEPYIHRLTYIIPSEVELKCNPRKGKEEKHTGKGLPVRSRYWSENNRMPLNAH
jgi:hypothetical protein